MYSLGLLLVNYFIKKVIFGKKIKFFNSCGNSKDKILALFLILFCNLALAVEVADMYHIKLNVSSMEQGHREEAFKLGLKELVGKVSGSDTIIDNEIILQEINSKYLDYIQSYSYGGGDEQLSITIEYSEYLLNKLLLEAGYRVWGTNRPLTLVWLAVGDDNSKSLVNYDVEPKLVSLFENMASNKAIPLVFPLLDLEDRANAKIEDVWEQMPSIIRKISKRYSVDSVLSIKLHKAFLGEYHSVWQLLVGNKAFVWKLSGYNKEEIIRLGFGELTKNLLASYAIEHTENDARATLFAFSSIRSITDYARVLAYLEKLGTIESIRVTRVFDDKLIIELVPVTDIMAIKRNIALDYILEPVDTLLKGITQEYVLKS